MVTFQLFVLTVNAIWKGLYHPPNCRKIREDKRQNNQHNFCKCPNPLGQINFWKGIFETLSTLGACHVSIIWGVIMQEICNFLNFFENTTARFYHFFIKSFLVASSYQYLAVDIKNLITSALVTVGKRLEVPI